MSEHTEHEHEGEGEGTSEHEHPAFPEAAAEPGAETRLLATLYEYHHELGADSVCEADLLAQTPGDEAKLEAALDRLLVRGEVYRPREREYVATSAEVRG